MFRLVCHGRHRRGHWDPSAGRHGRAGSGGASTTVNRPPTPTTTNLACADDASATSITWQDPGRTDGASATSHNLGTHFRPLGRLQLIDKGVPRIPRQGLIIRSNLRHQIGNLNALVVQGRPFLELAVVMMTFNNMGINSAIKTE